jgi:hypothetical protein
MIRFIPDLEPIIAAIRQTLSSHGLEALLAKETVNQEPENPWNLTRMRRSASCYSDDGLTNV